MGRLDVKLLRYLTSGDFRLLTAVEMGMKNHEVVPAQLVANIAKIKGIGVARRLRDLVQHRLLAYERGKNYDGYRLTNLGYDFLALHVLSNRDAITGVAQQIGVGKESDIFLASNANGDELVLKFHRLGRTSFRRIKEKRDYHKKRAAPSWIYLSRLAAVKEYSFMKALYDRNFAVPEPIDHCRHCIVMRLVKGKPLSQINNIRDPSALYDNLMSMIVQLAEHGLIHSDFNEFNIMLDPDTEQPVMIDFPQMVSTSHLNAVDYFNRDVQCVRDYMRKRFAYVSEEAPTFDEISKEETLDEEVAASGFTSNLKRRWDKVLREEQSDRDSNNGDSTSESEEYEDNEEIELKEKIKLIEKPKEMTKPISHIDAWMNKLEYVDLPITISDDVNGDQVPDLLASDISKMEIRSAREQCSASTIASTIPPEVIKSRVSKEEHKKSNSNYKVKVKGNASAINRKRNDNKTIMKEYEGWDDFRY